MITVNNGSSGRPLASGNTTYFVRTDGNDSNSGLVNSSGGAKLTLQGAWNALQQIDLNGFTGTISMQTGTFTGGLIATAAPVGGPVSITGSSTTISTTSADCLKFNAPCNVTLSGLTLQTTTSGNCINSNSPGVNLTIGSSMTFGACAGSHMVHNAPGSVIYLGAAYSITGGAAQHMAAQFGSTIANSANFTVTLTGTPAFSARFVYCGMVGVVSIVSGGVTYSGSATGTRYLSELNGVINSYGGGANYFPGNAAGTATTGQYA